MSASSLLRNIFSNHVRFAVTGLTGLLVTPILFHSLKAESYAILVFALAAANILENMDIGLFTGLIRFVSDFAERDERRKLQRLTSSVFFFIAGVAAVSSSALWLLSPALARFFRVTGTTSAPGHVVVALLGAGMVFQVPGTVLRGYLQGCQDFVAANAVDTAAQIVRALLAVILVWRGFGLLAIAAVYPATALLRFAGMLLACRLAPIPFTPRIQEANFESLREIFGFASLSFLGENADWCLYQLDTFLVPRFLPLASLSIQAIARRFPSALVELSYLTFFVAYPLISSATARGDNRTVRKFLFLSARNLLALALPIAVFLYFWAEPLLRIWIGGEVTAGVPVFRILLFFAIFASLRQVPLTFLFGVGKIGFSAAVSSGMLVAGIILGAWACAWKGLPALAVALSAIQAAGALLLFRHAAALAEIDVWEWLQSAVIPPAIALLPAGIWFWLSLRIVPHNLAGLAASAISGMALFVMLLARLITGPQRQSWRSRARKLLYELD